MLVSSVEPPMEDTSVLSRPVPILESSPSSGSLPPVITTDPTQVYSRHPHDPSPASSPNSGISSSPLVFDIAPTRVRRPPSRLALSSSTNHPNSKYISY